MTSEEFLKRIPRDFARDHLVLSSGSIDGTLQLTVSEHTAPAAIHNVGVRLGTPIATSVGQDEQIALSIDKAYESHSPSLEADPDEAVEDDLDVLLNQADRDLLTTEGKGPVVRLVDAILFEALSCHASDVHVQPLEDRALVRFRVDGVLKTVRELPSRVTGPVTSRIKVMGRMDIAEKRIPQDGRATVTIGAGDRGRAVDLRISTLPTSFGERAVIRLLDTSGAEHLLSFESLGMPDDVVDHYLSRASRSSGIILLTGPTGSGKTTTLYTTLRWIASRGDRGDVNVMTIEDPIEYELSTPDIAISQAQVNAKKGVTFARGLRHILRQDPDVIMVGEIRDFETATIAIQASLTGHLVFSTLHTNDAASAVARLADLGVERYLVSASLSAVLAQRLLRTLHRACDGAGCEACLDTGFKGRVGLFELLLVDDIMRERIAGGATASEIREVARQAGMRSLQAEGVRLAESNVTSRAEIERIVWGLD